MYERTIDPKGVSPIPFCNAERISTALGRPQQHTYLAHISLLDVLQDACLVAEMRYPRSLRRA